ncbi:MAG: SUMF1/EgtB/PvdO family nonheme iron enzyme [Candidatus Parabeggiatoa sp.]|nr:SUMF1/EgtB/PvdO family nonheme iron enzyme [Candidatus Parabeggiatoa sp.]
MGRYPLTVAEFRQFVEATGYQTEAEKGKDTSNWRNPSFPQQDDQPVVRISWNDAMAYIDWLTQQTDQKYCLPSEAQWEYAARAGTDTDYWWGNEIGQNRAVCYKCGSQWDNKQTAPVGSFEPNPFGLYDTVGNVWEWCADAWHKNYEGAPTNGSVWEGDSSLFVLRGGSWGFVAMWVRSESRFRGQRIGRNGGVGVRLARIL